MGIFIRQDSTKGYDTRKLVFSGGELLVDLPAHIYADYPVHVSAVIKSSDDIMNLLLLDDGLKRRNRGIEKLYIPYIPYAREDRPFEGTVGSVGALLMSKLINMIDYNEVHIVDPHSEVSYLTLNRKCYVKTQRDVWAQFLKNEAKDALILSPDLGASKKLLGKFERPHLTAHKQRDIMTGEILGIEILDFPPQTKVGDVVIIDDICDGGRTFTELAKVLIKNHNPSKITLCVTHGIFSKGLEVFDGLIDEVWTTNTLSEQYWGNIEYRRVK